MDRERAFAPGKGDVSLLAPPQFRGGGQAENPGGVDAPDPLSAPRIPLSGPPFFPGALARKRYGMPDLEQNSFVIDRTPEHSGELAHERSRGRDNRVSRAAVDSGGGVKVVVRCDDNENYP